MKKTSWIKVLKWKWANEGDLFNFLGSIGLQPKH
jgi:hypothetical protein